MQKQISVSWSDVELRDALFNLATHQNVPVFLDRRVDPNQSIKFSAERLAVAEVIYQVADQTGCGVGWLGDVAYVGPKADVARMIVLHEQLIRQLQRLPTAQKRKYLTTGDLRIPRLSKPNELLKSELRDLGIDQPKDELPHDLWPEYQIKSLRAIDKLILLSFGFGKWPQFTKNQYVGMSEPPEAGSSESRIRIDSKNRREVMAKLKTAFPESSIRSDKNYLVAKGTPAELYAIRRKLVEIQNSQTPESSGGTTVVSGRIKCSIGQALKSAAAGLSVELKFDPSLRSILLQQIDLNVTRITHEELIVRALEGTELEYSLDNEFLTVTQKLP